MDVTILALHVPLEDKKKLHGETAKSTNACLWPVVILASVFNYDWEMRNISHDCEKYLAENSKQVMFSTNVLADYFFMYPARQASLLYRRNIFLWTIKFTFLC